jgi:TRAP-type C4-dicarboxylate transport system substrate-binding protein
MICGQHRTRDKVGTAVASAMVASLLACLPANAQSGKSAGKTYVMKLSTATLNDTQHEWMKRYAAAVEKDSGGRIKAELYPASQLGSIPRQIEGTQFGSIQGWIGPPEFLVGVDQRYEAMSAPALFTSQAQNVRVINDPPVNSMMLGLGANKGLVGVGLFPIGPSSVASKKAVRHLADFKGMKIRVLASPFQLEMIKRIDGSPVAMSLADVLPALQQGAIDGALSTITVFTTLHYGDAAKYSIEIGQPYVNTIAVLSKKWVDGLPADLQKILHDDGATVSKDIVPWVNDFFAAQQKVWKDKGGEMIDLPPDEQAAMLAKFASVGNDLSKDKPDLNKAVNIVAQSAARNK